MKKILIAGSSSGIGKNIAEKMLKGNNQVIGLARNHDKFKPDSIHYFTYSIDFSKISFLEEELKKVQSNHNCIDAIICSIGYGEFIELEQFSVEKMQMMLNVNFLSQAILVKKFLPQLKKNQSGHIIFIGSECALEGQKKATMYAASKFALRGFAQSLRKECANANVSVTLINPGIVDTPFFLNLPFNPKMGELYAIQGAQIAALVTTILDEKSNCVYEEINLQPMKKSIVKKKQV
jgi:short-subunit dehydrogenase